MKILILTNYYPPFYKGGYELACETTVKFLRNQGHTMYILTGDYQVEKDLSSSPWDRGTIEPDRAYRLYQFIDYLHPSFLNKHQVEKYNYRITRQFIEGIKPDLVYIWNMQGISTAPVLATQATGYPKIFEIGDFWPGVYQRPGWKAALFRNLKKWIPGLVGGDIDLSPVISVGKWMAAELEEKYNARNIHVIPNGIPLPLDPGPKPKTEGPVRYVFAGRVDPEKGIHLAIEAFRTIRIKYPEFQFLFDIYGQGDEKYTQECRDKVRDYKLEEMVVFRGKSSDMSQVYPAYEVLVMPTMMREPFGLVLIEAMAWRMPVISFNHYGPAEIVSDGIDGRLVTPGNVDELAEAIYRMGQDSDLRQRMGEKGRRKVENQYDLRIVKSQVEQLLLKTVGVSKPTSN